jgi:integrase
MDFKMKLTIKTIDAIKPDGRDHVEWDDEVPRYGLRVKPSGVKSFVVQYRTAQGRSRKLTIGRYGPWAPEQARTEAKRLLRLVDQGADPAEAAAKEKEAITVAQLCDIYISAAEAGLVAGRLGNAKKAGTISQDKTRIGAHINPLIGQRLVRDLTKADARRFYENVARGHNAKRRSKNVIKGGASAAKRCVGLCGSLLSYSVQMGYRPEGPNPFGSLRLPADRKRSFRLEPDGWRALSEAIGAAEARGVAWQVTGIAKLIALSGCRLREISDLRWSEVDFAGRCLQFDPGRVKSGVMRPLGYEALENLRMLRNLNRAPNSAFVFPITRGDKDRGYQGFHLAWIQVNPSFSAHFIRHAFASTAENDCGLHESTVGALLGHSKGSGNVTRGYIVKRDSVLLSAANKVSGFISAAMSGKEFQAEIVPVGARA